MNLHPRRRDRNYFTVTPKGDRPLLQPIRTFQRQTLQTLIGYHTVMTVAKFIEHSADVVV